MRVTNTNTAYGAVALSLHWLIGLSILGLLGMGLYMEGITDTYTRFQIYQIHKSLGITVLGLAAARVIWRFANVTPMSLPEHKQWEKKLAGLTHFLLYVFMFAMPLSGWIMSAAGGRQVSFFGLFNMPAIIPVNEELGKAARAAHGYIAYTLMFFIALHAAGAIKHYLIDRDSTLTRMLPFLKPRRRASLGSRLGVGIVALVMAASLPAQAQNAPEAPKWAIDPTRSALVFEATQQGAPFTGDFKNFTGDIFLDPESPESGHAVITIDLTSVDSKDAERDQNLKGADWFNTGRFATATYTVTRFEKLEGGDFIARGNLDLHGIKKTLDLPFTLETKALEAGGSEAHARGSVAIKRLDHAVGSGAWSDTDAVGNEVKIHVNLYATAP